MSQTASAPLRVLFCIGVNQNFFDLPTGQTGMTTGQDGMAWEGFITMLTELSQLPGVTVLGTIDDDQSVVGPAYTWPWTCYILAEVPDHRTVAAACNLLRTIQVGESGLWRYMKIEARVGRPLPEPWTNASASEKKPS
ncbi:iacB [Streptomyces viridochromogenes]|uniref:IacB n=1 Tax=Streptomyces viridochromogenes TaxID=1938 RepID=A0A0J7Z586_STRVR|nr:hypothetical protein [Streptomyces viridochromogenes]KMS71336.1 iacB [Streptomyces viridochromogenes]KOG16618.1 iacB [Streptomyces viridochromogenes]KOG17324.1 iacB [Streptomyces viridochromogenes]